VKSQEKEKKHASTPIIRIKKSKTQIRFSNIKVVHGNFTPVVKKKYVPLNKASFHRARSACSVFETPVKITPIKMMEDELSSKKKRSHSETKMNSFGFNERRNSQ
jgi:hypothetical protein